VSISICILASGSSGNCSVIRTSGGVMLVDVGLSPRATSAQLSSVGVELADVSSMCLTHLDGDHFQTGWRKVIVERQIKVFCSELNRRHLLNRDNHPLAPLVRAVDFQAVEPLGGLCMTPIELRHDMEGSTGFRFDSAGESLGFATDLGRVPPVLIEAFTGVNMLAIESNYDVKMQLQSSRPNALKSRIMGGSGHLSNDECFAAVTRIFDRSQLRCGHVPSQIVLLHRSRQCNCPDLLRRQFERDPRFADRLTLAHQDQPTPWLRPVTRPTAPGEQLLLGWPTGAALR